MRRLRALTEAERAGLSRGLVRALEAAGVQPRIVDGAHLAARIASLWRGHVPILTLGRTVHWPEARDDFADSPGEMAVLQHELHHVLEFATGAISPFSYIAHPRNWTYEVTLTDTCCWTDFGAEQRAVLAERLWWAEHGAGEADRLRSLVPWA
jgi:hypothetical protein